MNDTSSIRINPRVTVWADELEERFVRGSGPGGQNVNKVSTAVQLRFDLRNARGLPYDVRLRLKTIAGKRLSRDGVIVIDARRHRTQERNRQDARERLVEMLEAASIQPARRVPTAPSRSARQRRMNDKKRRGQLKQHRAKVGLED